MKLSLLVALALAAALPACGGAPDEESEETEDMLAASPDTVLTTGTPGAAISARATTFTLSFTNVAQIKDQSGKKVLVLAGKSSRNLTSISSWVPDDAFGEVVQKTPRTFDVILRDGHEINSILSGLPLNLAIQTSTGSVKKFEAALHLGAIFGDVQGDARIKPGELIPVLTGTNAENLVYRSGLELTSTPTAVTVSGATVSKVSARRWNADFTFDAFFATTYAAKPVSFGAQFSNGAAATTARPVIGLRALGLTTKTVEQAWPSACQASVRSCITKVKNASGADFGVCGRAREVMTCMNEEPPPPADVTKAAKLIAADIKAKTGVAYDIGVAEVKNGVALAFLPWGGTGEWSVSGSAASFQRFVWRPTITDTNQVQRFQKQMSSLGFSGYTIVAHGTPSGNLPQWQLVIEKGLTRKTIQIEATSATTSKLVPFVYDERAFRELAGHLLVDHMIDFAAQSGLYAELEVYLRASALLSNSWQLPLGGDAARATFTGSNVWGDLECTVTIDKSTGATTVTHQN